MNDDALAIVSESAPDVDALLTEWKRAWAQDPDVEGRIAESERVRYMIWPGQHPDGLKHQELMPEGKRALPYDRAPDCRVPLADDTCNALVDVDYASFWNARIKVAPTSTSRLSLAQAAEWRALISWMIHGPLRHSLVDNVEFASQVMHTVGSVVLHPVWRRRTQLRLAVVSFAQLVEMAQDAPDESVLQMAPELVTDPTREAEAARLLRMMYPHLTQRRAARAVRELREAGPEGSVEFPVPDVVESVPELNVLVPWQDFILPVEGVAQPDKARVMFRRVFWSEAMTRQMAAEEEWDEKFLAMVIETKGRSNDEGHSVEHAQDQNLKLIEIIYAFTRGVDEDGVAGLYCTIVSPHISGNQEGRTIDGRAAYAKHFLVDYAHHQFPFIVLNTEVTGRRATDARGVPDVVRTAQNEIKQQRDATYVYSQMTVTPPLQKRGTQASKLPPELGPFGILNNASGSDWAWFPPPAGNPQIAFELQNLVRKECEDYFGIPRGDTPPQRYQARQQRRVTRVLSKWAQALWQLSVLAYQNLSPEELTAILGRAPLLNAELISHNALLLWFDVRAMDPEWVESLLTNISNLVLPADAAGVVDRAKLVTLALTYLDPTLAEEVTMDQAGAKMAMVKEVRDEVSQIMQGNAPIPVENDPAAANKLSFTDTLIQSNPMYNAQLTPGSPVFDQRKAALMDEWKRNLLMSVKQQQNKIVGRLGIVPQQ